MKEIKKVVLKDTTKLTNSEMKKIRGGYEPEKPVECSTACYDQTGTIIDTIYAICDPGDICDISYDKGIGKIKCIVANHSINWYNSSTCPYIDLLPPPIE